jgi:AraC-like DNA-binding protein
MQRNREVHLRPGDFVICSTAEPYTLQFRDAYEMPVLGLPADTMRRLTRDPDQFLGVHMSGEDADCGLLSSFVAQVAARMSRLQDPMISRIEANILNLLGGVLSARARPGICSVAEQLSQMQAFIHEHLRDRRLGPGMIAAAFGISTRYVHKLFEDQPMTLGRYIRSLRVQACRQMLEAHSRPDLSLTDVALAWGFYDLSHMSRCFREEFHLTPSEVRSLAAH